MAKDKGSCSKTLIEELVLSSSHLSKIAIMEASPMIRGKNNDHDFSVNSADSTFHKHDNLGLTQTQVEASGIEMMKVMPFPRVSSSYSYTSLRDIMPLASPHLNSSNNNCASWNEIPIKNPLLKQAALAYLHPMSTPSDEVSSKGFFRSLKDNCFGWLCGGFFNTLLDAFLGFFCGARRRRIDGNAEEEQKEEEDDDGDDDAEEEDNVD